MNTVGAKMIDFPMFNAEARMSARRWPTFQARAVYGVLLLAFFWIFLLNHEGWLAGHLEEGVGRVCRGGIRVAGRGPGAYWGSVNQGHSAFRRLSDTRGHFVTSVDIRYVPVCSAREPR